MLLWIVKFVPVTGLNWFLFGTNLKCTSMLLCKIVTVTGLKFIPFVAMQMSMKFEMFAVTYFVSVSLFLSVRFCVCYKHKALEKLLEALVLWILASHHKGC